MFDVTIDPSGLNAMMTVKDSITIQNSSELREALLNSIQKVKALYITHDGLEECDLSYLQILIAAHKYSAKQKSIFKVIGKSPASFIKMIEMYGCRSFCWLEEKVSI